MRFSEFLKEAEEHPKTIKFAVFSKVGFIHVYVDGKLEKYTLDGIYVEKIKKLSEKNPLKAYDLLKEVGEKE